MPNNHNKRQLRKCLNIACKLLGLIIQPPRSKWGKRLMYGFLGIVAVILLGMYGIAEWYVHS
ncbi:MAG TPA: hypothetical protein VG604_05085, partial [Candidatus Saccharimonadales bacterium]|nr:hypothetical protein [Candidatus Saccharimonadales bacterium]